MKHSVLIPEKVTVRNMVFCLDSLAKQINRADKLDKTISGMRINRETRALEIEVEDETDGKEE